MGDLGEYRVKVQGKVKEVVSDLEEEVEVASPQDRETIKGLTKEEVEEEVDLEIVEEEVEGSMTEEEGLVIVAALAIVGALAIVEGLEIVEVEVEEMEVLEITLVIVEAEVKDTAPLQIEEAEEQEEVMDFPTAEAASKIEEEEAEEVVDLLEVLEILIIEATMDQDSAEEILIKKVTEAKTTTGLTSNNLKDRSLTTSYHPNPKKKKKWNNLIQQNCQ